MAFNAVPGDSGGGGSGGGGGGYSGGGSGSGQGGGGPAAPAYGAARDLALKLSPDLTTLIITLTPNDDLGNVTGVNYNVFWVDPSRFSLNDVFPPNFGSTPISQNVQLFTNGRIFVASIPGGQGVVSAKIGYAPFVSGGWMFAVVVQSGGSTEHRLSGTNFVAVPVIGVSGEPSSANLPTNLLVQDNVLSGIYRLIQFSWTNPVIVSAVKYMKITMLNYFNQNMQQDVAFFNINTKAGAMQGSQISLSGYAGQNNQQSVILQTDGGGHSVYWYFVPVSAAGTPLHLSACPFYTTTGV
jgi:hypothetical protein